MTKLHAITPLGGTEARTDAFKGLTINENPSRALASLAAREGRAPEIAKAVAAFAGVYPPDIGQTAFAGDVVIFWMGPDVWMVDAPIATHEDIATLVKAEVGDNGSVAEQTDGWCRFDLDGPRCHDVLERLCNVNTRAMTDGSVSRTQLDHLGCFVRCLAQDQAFSVIGPRSSARSLHSALVAAARSVI